MKKLLAIVLSIAIMLSVSIIPSVIVSNAETTPTYYVDAVLGNDENDGLSENAPLATIDKAQTLIAQGDTDTTGQDGTIIVIDTAEFDGGEAHKGMITIKGYDNNTVLTFNFTSINTASGSTMKAVILKGPTTIDGVKLPNVKSSANQYLLSAGHKLVFDNLIVGSSDGERIYYIGRVTDTPDNTRENVIVNSIGTGYGSTNTFYFGAASTTKKTSAGIDFTLNGGRVYNLNFTKGTTYSGNVNIVLNNFNSRGDTKTRFYNDGSTFEGAFHLIINNGKITNFTDAAVTNMNAVTATGGAWVLRAEKASDGSLLTTTENAGKFAINGDMVAKAYKVEDGTASEKATAISKKGILDLSEYPGVYDIKYSEFDAEENTDTVVYVSATGDDKDYGTENAPFATIDFAEKYLAKSTAEGEKKIIVMGTVDFDGGEPHSEMITIEGYDATASLNPVTTTIKPVYSPYNQKGVVLQGPTTFSNIYFPKNDNAIFLVNNSYEVKFENMPNNTKGSYYYCLGNVDNANSNMRQVITINDLYGTAGVSHMFYFNAANKTYKTSAGVDLTVNGGRVLDFRFYETTYTGDVNLVINDILNRDADTKVNISYSGATFNGAFQLVVNNGKFTMFRDTVLETVQGITATDGVWIVDGAAASDGTKLKTTEEEGKFLVVGNLIANAYIVTDGVKSDTAIKSIDGILDLSHNAGTYVVEYTTRQPEANSDSIVYVDAENGSDINSGISADNAFATFEFAANWLAQSDAENKEIVVIGNATYALSEHDYKLTISGYDATSTLKISGAVKGDTLFKNILLDGLNIQVDGNTVEFENSSVTTYTAGKLVIGPANTDTADDIHKIVINGLGASSRFVMGRIGKVGGVTNGDIDIVVNDGMFWQFSCEGTNTYNGNVSLTVNGGTIYNSNSAARYYFRGIEDATFNGALQFIINNDAEYSYSRYVDAEYLNANAAGGKWLIYSKAFDDAHSAKLSTTDLPGTYNVTGAKYAKAVDTTDSSKVYYSENGILTVPAGTYNVSYFNVLKQGDANGDGDLDIRDLVAMKTAISAASPLELVIDLDGSKKNDSGDLIVLAKHFLNVQKIEWEDTLNYLSNTYTKLVNDKELTVAFIGGSVTETPDEGPLGWPTLICNWLGEKYDADITEVRAGRSGTNSYFGVHRFDNEVGQYNPDLFFIEFAHNDYGPLDYETVKRTTESLILKAYEVNPNCDIVFVLNTADDVETMNYSTLRGHRETAEKYGLKTIKMGDKFYEHLEITGISRDYYIKDYVHPNVEGNALYADIISEQLCRDLPYNGYATNEIIDHTKSLPEPLYDPMLEARMLDAGDIDLSESTGWTYNPNGKYISWKGFDIYNGTVSSSTPGSVLKFQFEGKGLGLLYARTSNIGKISVVIDGGEPIIIDGYDSSAKPGHLPITPVLEDLEYSTHTVVVTLLEEKNEKSSGNLFSIPAFLIH